MAVRSKILFLMMVGIAFQSLGESKLPSFEPVETYAPNVGLSATAGLTFEQKPGSEIPKDAQFIDENGQTRKLSDFLQNGPVVLGLAYFNCPNICTVVIRETFQALQALRFKSQEKFTLLFVSIDPNESWELASKKRRNYLGSYKRSDMAENTHFLVGPQPSIQALTAAVGFQYRYDERSKQFIHPAGLTFLTPEGKVSRYLMGARYEPLDFRLALVEASQGKIGSIVDHAILFCYKYDPTQGKYGFVIMSTLRVFGALTVTALGGYVITMLRRERRRRRRNEEGDSVR